MGHPALELKTSTHLHTVLAPNNEPWQVGLKDPAVSVMTDFRVRALFKVEMEDTIDEALHKMKIAGLRIAFVLDKESDKLLGMITSYDIMGEKPMRYLQSVGFQSVGFADRGVTRKDIRVKDIIDSIDDWVVAELHDVEQVNVKAVLEALQKSGRTHLPVLEHNPGETPRLRGLFSSAKILRLTEFARLRQANKA
jgi:CBS domain-containing protein